MTELYIDGQLAALPEGFNITFTSENPYFTRSSNYSLDIELPMPANHAIFKHVNRLDVTKKKTILSAMLIVDARCLLYGSAVLLSVEDTLVKVQLVSGNAEFNLLTNDTIYIDELDLGSVGWPNNNQNYFQPPANMVGYYGSVDDVEVVWLPVFYQEAQWKNLNNDVIYEFGTNNFTLCPYARNRCVQPYLITVIKRIVEYFGYTFDTSFFNDNFLRNVYICSAVTSNKIADALPHWTISEFFDELERFLCVVTVVDERTKVVRLVSLNEYFSHSEKEIIDSSALIREFTVEIEDEKNEKDLSSGNVGYDLPSHTDDGYLRIERDIVDAAYKLECDTYDTMVAAYNGMNDNDKKSTLFVVGKRYYINYNENDQNKLREVNLYADLIRNPESSDIDTSLKIVPAKILQFNVGVYGSVAEYTLNRPYAAMYLNIPAVGYQATTVHQERFNIQEAISGDVELQEKQEKNEYMEVAINTGKFNRQDVTYSGQVHSYDYAYPFTDYQQKTTAQLTDFLPYSLSLNDVCPDSIGHRFSILTLFHSDVPYTIRFHANRLPNVNKVFLIGNKQYLCEKIEAEIDANGLNKVLKGTFYRVE